MDPGTFFKLLPKLISAGMSAAQAIKLLSQGESPFGSKGKVEQYSQDSPQVQKWKERLQPRIQNLLEQRLGELEQPQQSPYEQLSQSPMAPLLMGMAPGIWDDLGGDPEAGMMDSLTPLIRGLTAQGVPQLAQWLQGMGQQQQPPQQQKQPLTPEQLQQVLAASQARDQQAAQFNPYSPGDAYDVDRRNEQQDLYRQQLADAYSDQF